MTFTIPETEALADAGLETLDADFYGFQNLLTAREQH